MNMTIGIIILFVGFIALVLFKRFDAIEMKNNKYRRRRFFIFYYLVAMFFSGITFAASMILLIFSIDNKNWIFIIIYVLIGLFSLMNFISYAERFVFCLPKKR